MKQWRSSDARMGFACFAAMAAVAWADPGGVGDDRRCSAGRWRITSVVMDGKEVDPGLVAMLSVVYGVDGTWVVMFKSIAVAEGTSTVDPTNEPKTFEMRTSGPVGSRDQGWLYRGIYEMAANNRRLCFASADRQRPRSFSSERRSGHILVHLERATAR